jgi:hypothetical protein
VFQRVYHITHQQHRESILRQGLVPQGWQSVHCKWQGLRYPPRTYVSTVKCDRRAMDYVGLEGLDCWTFVVLRRQLQKDSISSSSHHYYLEHLVQPTRLRLVASL